MAVDPYAICPCGSGKKLKFCCADVAADMEKIQRMIDGDQPRAALQHATQTLAKNPRRTPLLDLKATLEIMLGELDDAQQTVQQFLEAEPNNASAHAQQAIVLAAAEGGRAAVDPLQQALVSVEKSMPRRVLEAIGAVGQALLMEGNIVAARAHLWLYQGIAGDQDTRAFELLVRLNQSAALPLMLRDHLYMRAVPEDHPSAVDHDRAQVFASRGMWRAAAQVLDSLCDLYPELPTLAYNRGLVHGWLGDTKALAAGLHVLAAAYPCEADPIDYDDAVEAEAIAQLVDPDVQEPPVDVVKLTYDVMDEETLVDRLTTDARIVPSDVNPADYPSDAGPPPRAAYLLLDRPLPESGIDIQRDAVPRVVGLLSHFGRQTDRPERLELVLDRNDAFDDSTKGFAELAGDALGAAGEERLGESDAGREGLSWRWRFPRDTPPRRRRELLVEQRREMIVSEWPATKQAMLGGRTPEEAAKDQPIAAAAALLRLEQGGRNYQHPDELNGVRDRFGLPELGPIDPEGVFLEQLPVGRVPRLELDKLSDDALVELYQRAALLDARAALSVLTRAILDRPTAAEKIDAGRAFYQLISQEEDVEAALSLLATAREWSEAAGQSTAEWDLLELELHIVEGVPEEANRVLSHLREHHLQEPGVAEQLYQIMYALGATPESLGAAPAGAMPAGAMPAAAPVEPAASEGQIWTPDSAGADNGPAKKLWTPT